MWGFKVTQDQIKQWLENCLKDPGLFDHEQQLLKVMIAALPTEKQQDKDLFGDLPKVERQDGNQAAGEFILTSKGKKLKGADMKKFILFWDAFDHKKVSHKREAAHAWVNMKDVKDEAFMAHIVAAARHEAATRTDPPKHAQGWLSGGRWERYSATATTTPKDWSVDDWCARLGNPDGKFARDFHYNSWPRELGPSPWDTIKTIIPEDVYGVYAEKWGWKIV